MGKIALRNSGIETAGEPGKILETAPNLVELDIQGNALGSWREVSLVARELRRLAALNVSRMRLDEDGGVVEGAFQSLVTLVANEGKATWGFVKALAGAMPVLRDLHLKANGISRLPTEPGVFATLTVLTLEDNGISDWAEVAQLAHLPALEHLGLNQNALDRVEYPATGGFLALRSLSLNHNAIAEWRSIDELDRFPRLDDLRFQNNPITGDVGFSLARQMIIGRVSKLTSLNGSTVRERERIDSEKTYLRKALGERVASEASGSGSCATFDMAARHPRYAALVAKHGEPAVARAADGPKGGLAEDVITVTIRCVAPSLAMNAPHTRKLPLSLTIRNLKLICQQLFTLAAAKQRLHFRDTVGASRDGPLPEELSDDSRTLAYYGVREQADIFVNELDEDKDAKEKEEELRRREASLQSQIKAAEEKRANKEAEVAGAKEAAMGAAKSKQ